MEEVSKTEAERYAVSFCLFLRAKLRAAEGGGPYNTIMTEEEHERTETHPTL